MIWAVVALYWELVRRSLASSASMTPKAWIPHPKKEQKEKQGRMEAAKAKVEALLQARTGA
jgi:hypothetical protein